VVTPALRRRIDCSNSPVCRFNTIGEVTNSASNVPATAALTLTVNVQVLVLPEVSVAVQVTVVTPIGKLEPDGGTQVVVTPGQLSDVLGENPTVAEFWPKGAVTIALLGHVIVGRSVSLTVTVKLQVLVLPLASVAVQITVVTPFENVEPDGGLNTTVTLVEQLSVALAENVMFEAEHWPGSVGRIIFDGQEMVGGVWSRTTTNCWQVAVLPPASLTVHVTVFVPGAKLAGALFVTLATPQLSAVTGVPSATLVALQPELAATTTFEGQVIVGGVWSRTTTSC
jgi:hypothetical protein